MRYFIDTEFYENGSTIQLISIGIVSEDGREFYAESAEFNWALVPPKHWLEENVRPHLENGDGVRCSFTRAEMRFAVQQFIYEGSGKPIFYGYYADYDWVVLCQLYGTMMQLPKGFPMYCRDLKQMLDERELGSAWTAKHCPKPEHEHHALADALWNARLYRAMMVHDKMQHA